jgi:hypothetical protein
MGGVAGHMDHLYDNRGLTFAKMKEIMQAGADAELSTEEKVDGQNLFLSYSIPEGKAKGARNKGNLRQGGLDASGLAKKFAGRGGLEKAFNSGFSAFERAVGVLSDEEKQRIFGTDANIWYNAEVMDPGTEGDANDPGAVNVIKYDNKTLKIHNVGHFAFNRETGEKEQLPEGALETLDNALERMQEALSGHNFSLARQAIIQLKKIENQEPVQQVFSKINTALAAENLSDNATVEEYLSNRLMKGLDTNIPESLRKELVKYLLETPDNIGKREIKKGLSKEEKLNIDDIVMSKRMILREAILPIEMAVHDYTVEILKGVKSVFIANTGKEVDRLKQELAKAVKEITAQGPEDPSSMEIMQFHLNKIKDFSQITTPVEAVVFDYDGHTYKFAGNFAPLNQILGMFRYPKTKRKLATESINSSYEVLTEKTGKRIALIPGGFKPPHAGHFLLAKHFANKKDVDEVIVIVSTKSRPPVTVDMAIKLWQLYTKQFPKIKVRSGTTPSPVGDVYELVADNSVFQEGDVALLGKSEKDVDDKRFDRAQSYAERNNPGVKVESVVTPVFAGGVSGTIMRNFILARNKESFKKNLPKHLSQEEKDAAYDVVAGTRESLDTFIDSKIEEMSSMAAGSIEGAVGAFGAGSANNYNPYSRKKTKKPKIKKAKRQRRR